MSESEEIVRADRVRDKLNLQYFVRGALDSSVMAGAPVAALGRVVVGQGEIVGRTPRG